MTKIKIDNELIFDIIHVWHNFRKELSSESDIGDRDKARIAGYLTIAYMFGAEREDEDRPKCEHCGHTPRCSLFGPSPTKCDWCGADLVKRDYIGVEEEKERKRDA